MKEWCEEVKLACARMMFEKCLVDNDLINTLCDVLDCGEYELMSAFSELFEKDE